MLSRAAVLLAAIALASPALASSSIEAQSDTVRAGAPSLGALVLVPGTDSSDTYFVRNGERRLLATYIEEVSRTGEGYLIVGRNVGPNGTVLSLDSVLVASGTLAPIWHADSTRAGRTRIRYANGRMQGTLVDSSGATRTLDVAASGTYDYSTMSRILNLLPLRAGYDVVLASHDIHRGPQYTRLTVLGEEEIEVRGHKVAAFKLELDYGRFKAQRWIDRATRRDLRTTVNAGGREMVVEYR